MRVSCKGYVREVSLSKVGLEEYVSMARCYTRTRTLTEDEVECSGLGLVTCVFLLNPSLYYGRRRSLESVWDFIARSTKRDKDGSRNTPKITDCLPHAVVHYLYGCMKPLYYTVLYRGTTGMLSSFKSLVAEVGEAEVKAREAKMAKERQERQEQERIRKAKELEKKKQAEQEAAADASARAKAKAEAEAKAKAKEAAMAKAKAEEEEEDVSQEGRLRDRERVKRRTVIQINTLYRFLGFGAPRHRWYFSGR